MDALDNTLKTYFKNALAAAGGRARAVAWPSEEEFCLFIDDRLKGEALERVLDCLRREPEAREMVLRARQLIRDGSESGPERVPAASLERAKALMPAGPALSCPHCGKAVTPFKKPLSAQARLNFIWLVLASAAFVASFFYPRYFLQCLTLALVFGVKWIFDARALKTQIMIYKALQEDQAPAHSSRLHNPSGHL